MKKHLRRISLLAMALILVFCSGCAASKNRDSSAAEASNYENQGSANGEASNGAERSESKLFTSDYDEYITLLEAIDLADSYLEHFELDASKATLADVLSEDESGNYEGQGIDGARYKWGLAFQKTSNPEESYAVEIAGGQVTSCVEGANAPGNGVIDLSEEIIDSKQAQKIAEEYGLQPGTVWPIGYDYGLSTDVSEDGQDRVVLTVYGQHENSTFAVVTIDARTGEILSAAQKEADSEDSSVWVDW